MSIGGQGDPEKGEIEIKTQEVSSRSEEILVSGSMRGPGSFSVSR